MQYLRGLVALFTYTYSSGVFVIVVLLVAWLLGGVCQRLLDLWHLVRRLPRSLSPRTAPPKGYRKIKPAVIQHRNKRKPDWVQRIDLGCPWQNGRVERFFGTLKRYLKQVQFDNKTALDGLLQDFGYWYNQIRPHQNLGGLTLLEARNGVDAFDTNQPPKVVRLYHVTL